MILIQGRQTDPQALYGRYPLLSMERSIIRSMGESGETYHFGSEAQLDFELNLRRATVNAAIQLNRSGMDFGIFRKSRCNPAFWERTDEGGFVLKRGVRPSEAINDIFSNGRKYATECATAIVIVYYKAVLDVYPDTLFDRVFPQIQLMNWHYIDPLFRNVGLMRPADEFFPGDRMYFMNPDVNPATPEWQGENVILLSADRYYGHGIGIESADGIINALNQNRIRNAQRSAYLLKQAGRPDYRRLYQLQTGSDQ